LFFSELLKITPVLGLFSFFGKFSGMVKKKTTVIVEFEYSLLAFNMVSAELYLQCDTDHQLT
jgi:hypothetical protein